MPSAVYILTGGAQVVRHDAVLVVGGELGQGGEGARLEEPGSKFAVDGGGELECDLFFRAGELLLPFVEGDVAVPHPSG